ncbi:uncharacterized protein LOC144575683 isoform X2 [Carex rostrata]
MAERSRNSPSSSRIKKLKFSPKAPVSKGKKPTARSSLQQETEEKFVIDKDIMTRMGTRRRQAVRKCAAGMKDDSADQKPQSSSREHSQSEAKKEKNYGPCIVLPLRPDNTNSEELNKIEFGQTSLTSSEMEASINPAKDLGLEKTSEQERMLLFKFPNPLPCEIPAVNAEGTENKGKTKAKKTGCSLQQLPAGYVGKMLVYKSGKVKMKLGDVVFNVDSGVKCTFHEQAVAVNTKKGHFCQIGNVEQHVVVTPDVDALLEGSKK